MSNGRTYHKNNRPPFVVDQNSLIRTLGRQVNFDKCGDQFKTGAFKVTVGPAGAAADATSVPIVGTLGGALKKGYLLSFGGKKFARLSADVAAGVASLPVDALATALVSGDSTFAGGTGNKRVPAGTCIVEDTDGKVYPRINETGAKTAYGFLETDAQENSPTDAETGYGVIRGGSLFENQLPDARANGGSLSGTWKTELKANDAQFMFDTYYDSRGA